MKTKDVFTPGRYPTFTFVGEHLTERANHLKGAVDSGSLIISLSGPSKSGKTVFIERELGSVLKPPNKEKKGCTPEEPRQ